MDIKTTLTLLKAAETLAEYIANPKDLARVKFAIEEGYEYLYSFKDEQILSALESLNKDESPEPGPTTVIKR